MDAIEFFRQFLGAIRGNLTFASIVLVLVVLLSGCTTEVRIARPDNWNPQINGISTNYVAVNNAFAVSSPGTTVQQTNVWVYWWSFNQVNIDPQNCICNSLAEVRVKTNIGWDLLSVLTLGTVQHYTLEWRCAKVPQSTNKDF